MGRGLCISRRTGESVYIGDDVVITIDAVDGGHVSMRISAPANVAIHRDAERVRRPKLALAASIKKGR